MTVKIVTDGELKLSIPQIPHTLYGFGILKIIYFIYCCCFFSLWGGGNVQQARAELFQAQGQPERLRGVGQLVMRKVA